MSKNTMFVAKIFEDAKLPTKKLITDAGWDFYYYGNVYFLKPLSYEIFRTGIRIKLPHKTFGLVKPKSRLNYLIGGGVIDEEYTGELFVKIFNPTLDVIKIMNGDPVAQLIIIPIEYSDIYEVDEEYFENKLKTERGNSGGIVTQVFEINENINS